MKNDLKDVLIRHQKPLLWAAGLIAVVVIFLGSSIISLVHNKREMHKLERQSAALDGQHQELLRKLDLLQKQNLNYLEEVARTQYNMVKPGEIQFRIPQE